VNLSGPLAASDSAMVSWLTKGRGLLMLGDLLPLSGAGNKAVAGATVKFDLPAGWAVHANDPEARPSEFNVSDIDHAVFVTGSRLRSSKISEGGFSIKYVFDGDWAFSDREAIDLASQILRAHRETFGGLPGRAGTLILLPFPQ